MCCNKYLNNNITALYMVQPLINNKQRSLLFCISRLFHSFLFHHISSKL